MFNEDEKGRKSMKLSTKAGDKPLWKQLYEIFQERIENGTYKSGEAIPSEPKIADEFGVSRITVRQAMDKLSADGLIERRRGKGTIVTGGTVNLLTMVTSSMTTLDEVNNTLNRLIEKVETVIPPAKVARLFEIGEEDTVIHVRRYSRMDGEIIAMFEHYLNPRYITELDDPFDSLYENIRKHSGRTIDNFTEEILAGSATFEEQQYLQVPNGSAILIRRRKGYSKDDLIEYTICKYNGNRYKMVIQTR